jgi:hypothetical protein
VRLENSQRQLQEQAASFQQRLNDSTHHAQLREESLCASLTAAEKDKVQSEQEAYNAKCALLDEKTRASSLMVELKETQDQLNLMDLQLVRLRNESERILSGPSCTHDKDIASFKSRIEELELALKLKDERAKSIAARHRLGDLVSFLVFPSGCN